VSPEGAHLTLKFLGNISPGMVDKVLAAMAKAAEGIPPFRLRLSGTGAFPSLQNPRVFWVGLDGELGTLARLQERVERAMVGLGFPREERAFSPHITLGRVRDSAPPDVRRRAAQAVREATFNGGYEWEVDTLNLMRSTLTPSGAIYSQLGQIPLSPPLSKGGEG
jgi:2'-5' RNA ligase